MAQCNSEKIIKKRTSHKSYLKLEDQELLKIIKKIMIENKAFTSVAYKEIKFIPFPTLKRRFKDIEVWQDLINYLHLNKEYQRATMKAKKKIITPAFIKNSVSETNEELLEMYKEFSEKIGAHNGASMIQLKRYGFKYSETVLLRRFGSWKNVKELCGYTFNLGTMYSKEEIVKLLMEAREKYGRRLSQKEINKDPNLPTLETVLKFFKTTKISSIWDELEKNLEKTSTEGKIYTLEEIKELLHKEYLEKGAPLTIVEIIEKTKEGKLPGKTTIYRHFKTQKIREIWKIVLEEREQNG